MISCWDFPDAEKLLPAALAVKLDAATITRALPLKTGEVLTFIDVTALRLAVEAVHMGEQRPRIAAETTRYFPPPRRR